MFNLINKNSIGGNNNYFRSKQTFSTPHILQMSLDNVLYIATLNIKNNKKSPSHNPEELQLRTRYQ